MKQVQEKDGDWESGEGKLHEYLVQNVYNYAG